MPISSLSHCSTVAQSNPAECGTQTRQCRAWSQQNCRHWLYSKQPSNKQQPDTFIEGKMCCSPQHHIIRYIIFHLRFRAVFLSNLKTWAIWMSHMTPFTCSMQVAKNNKEVLAFSGPIKKAAEPCWSGVGMYVGVTMTVVYGCYFDEHVTFSDVAFGIPRMTKVWNYFYWIYWYTVLYVVSFICCKEWSVFITQGIKGVIE